MKEEIRTEEKKEPAKKRRSRKKREVNLTLQDLLTQPSQLAHLPMMNRTTGHKVLIAVIQRLQGLWQLAKMQKNTPEHDETGQLYMNFLTDDFEVVKENTSVLNQGDVIFKLRLSDISDSSHYTATRTALYSLTQVKCFVPSKEEPGKFMTKSLMEIKGQRENGKFVGTDFDVIIPREVAQNILDINLFGNYTRFVGYTASKLKSAFSYPLYIYLSEEWRKNGENVRIPLKNLRQRLGFVRDADEPERETRYLAWSKFCEKVLEQTKKELDNLSEVGGADFTFEYKGLLHGVPVPARKNPDIVVFTIIPTEAGRNIKTENDHVPYISLAQDLMEKYFELPKKQTRSFMKRIKPPFMGKFIEHLNQRHEEFRTFQHPEVKKIAAWMYKDIDDFIKGEEKKFYTPAEEIKESTTEKNKVQVQQMDLWGDN